MICFSVLFAGLKTEFFTQKRGKDWKIKYQKMTKDLNFELVENQKKGRHKTKTTQNIKKQTTWKSGFRRRMLEALRMPFPFLSLLVSPLLFHNFHFLWLPFFLQFFFFIFVKKQKEKTRQDWQTTNQKKSTIFVFYITKFKNFLHYLLCLGCIHIFSVFLSRFFLICSIERNRSSHDW